jgi:Retinal pigment epithelial membrane protein/EF-hand domain pair
MPRAGRVDQMRWFRAPACSVFHFINGYTEGNKVHMDMCVSDVPALARRRDGASQQWGFCKCHGNGTPTSRRWLSPIRATAHTPAHNQRGGCAMVKLRLMSAAALTLLAGGAQAQTSNSNPFATGNPMHFEAKAMDTNGDKMITKEEMMAYAEKMWEAMANGKDTIRISVAAKDFATGGLAFNAKAIDTDHDGTISKKEFLDYAEHKFDKMAHPNGMISVEEAAKAFARGEPPPSK